MLTENFTLPMNDLPNIQRVDDDSRRTHAWIARVQRNNRIVAKMFSDCVYGGKSKAKKAATDYRKKLLSEVPLVEHQIWRRNILRRNNSSGIPGVGRYERVANPRTGRKEAFWLASWIDEHGASRKRKFSVMCHGEDQAKQFAIEERNRQLQRVCQINAEKTRQMLED